MPQQRTSALLIFVIFVLANAIITHAQRAPKATINQDWQSALSALHTDAQIQITTIDHPGHQHSCLVRSFTEDKIVCARGLRGTRTYSKQQILKLVRPSDDGLRVRLLLGLNSAAGAAIWGTVALVATCPACAAATSLAALCFLGAAGAVASSDTQKREILYIAPEPQAKTKPDDTQP